MFSAKLLLAVLATVVLTVNTVNGKHSQCGLWRGKFGKGSIPVVAKVMSVEQENRLQRRIKPESPSIKLAGGATSACSDKGYSTVNQDGICVWNGISTVSSAPAGYYRGWVNRDDQGVANCGKTVYIDAPGKARELAPVLDGCSFAKDLTEDEGCSTIWLTQKLFDSLGGTGSSITLTGWDFYSQYD